MIFQQNRIMVRSWPLQFCSMVLSGLLMGAREFAIYGMATIAAQGALAGIWFMGGVQDLQLSVAIGKQGVQLCHGNDQLPICRQTRSSDTPEIIFNA